ncbi:hypothetical protein ACFLQ2_00625 [archaeon]
MKMAKWYTCPKCGKTFKQDGRCSCGSATQQWMRVCGEAFPVSMLEQNGPTPSF